MVVSMKKCITAILVIIVMLSVFIILPVETCTAIATTIYVDDDGGADYTEIQDAINAANDGDTIYVYSGSYSENLVIDVSIILTADNSATVIISGSGDHTIKVYNDSVQITGFTVENTGESHRCIFLDSVAGCLIKSNIIREGGDGVYLDNSNSNTIDNNIIESNNIGLYFFNSDSNTVKYNDIQNNLANGVWLASTSTDNTFYENDFSGHVDDNAKDYGSNNWDYNSRGNYWDDYLDNDSYHGPNQDIPGSDGIGDNPYNITGAGNQDRYPLGDFLRPGTVAHINSISPNPANEDDTIYFSGYGTTDPDSHIIAWKWTANGIEIGNSLQGSTQHAQG